MREQTRQEMMFSEPHERDKREAAYFEARALENLIATMNTFISYYEEDIAQADEG